MRRQYYSIQVLRGVAALMVTLFHFLPQDFTMGAAGVDIFFVISGFIMGTVGTREKPLGFLYNRAVRIIPLYWIFTLLMCVAATAGFYAKFTFDAERLLKSLFFVPYRDIAGQIEPLLVVGWTLNLEVFFYAIFSVGLVMRAPIVFTTIVLAAMVAVGLGYAGSNPAIILWTSPLLLEFLFGLMLSRLAVGGKVGYLAIVLGFAGLIVSNILHWFDADYRLLTWGVPAALIVSGALLLENEGIWPRKFMRPLEIVGDASYSLYLTHGFVAAAIHKFITDKSVGALAGLTISLVVAILTFRLLERPVTKFLKTLGRSAYS